jgi:hypothetical protein
MPSSVILQRVALVRNDVSRYLLRLLVTTNVVSTSQILVTLIMEAVHSSETSALTKVTHVTFQKATFFIVTAMKTSNFTKH